MPAYDDRLYVPPAPVARVVLRHPERAEGVENVPMLIDSGADATLLPRRRCPMFSLRATGVCRRSVAILTIALVFSGSGKDYARAEEQKQAVVLDLVKATAERLDSGAVLLCCAAIL